MKVRVLDSDTELDVKGNDLKLGDVILVMTGMIITGFSNNQTALGQLVNHTVIGFPTGDLTKHLIESWQDDNS